MAYSNEELFNFLPHFLDDDIYVVHDLPEIKKSEQVLTELINIESIIIPEIEIVPEILKPLKISKKVIILLSYPQGIPSEISTQLLKIFLALNIQHTDIELINVTAANPDLLLPYDFQYLILMGGKGKSLNFLNEYAGKRDVLEVGKTANITVIFAEKLDIYLQIGNEDKKRNFWNTLKKAFT